MLANNKILFQFIERHIKHAIFCSRALKKIGLSVIFAWVYLIPFDSLAADLWLRNLAVWNGQSTVQPGSYFYLDVELHADANVPIRTEFRLSYYLSSNDRLSDDDYEAAHFDLIFNVVPNKDNRWDRIDIPASMPPGIYYIFAYVNS